MNDAFQRLTAVALCSFMPLLAGARDLVSYDGICDASAAVALGPDHFVVADDERNTLLIFRRGQSAAAGSLDVSKFLKTETDKESDLEGAASIGSRTYWISSHGRNSRGEVQERRLRLFAAEARLEPKPALVPIGHPYTSLIEDLIAEPKLGTYPLKTAAKKAPEESGGLNIEGLAATPDGRLLIGFRNPLIKGKALVVPLENPRAVIEGKKGRFGRALELDLGGRGVRSMELVGSGYLIVAGPPADHGDFALYRWSGNAESAPSLVRGVDLKGLSPEGLYAIPNSDAVHILSDDGGRMIGGVRCKDAERVKQQFRSVIVRL